MSKQCNIIEDLLPLYHDDVCSQESREMVDEHLARCEDCRKKLEQIHCELLPLEENASDIDALKSITKKIVRSQWKSLVKGIAITLALILAIFLYNTVLWYTREYTYYSSFAEDLPQLPTDPTSGTVRYYYMMDEDFEYSVTVPGFLTQNGGVRIIKKSKGTTEIFQASISRKGYAEYAFFINILREGTEEYHCFTIDSDLTLEKWSYRYLSDSELAQIQSELAEHEEEIRELVNAAKAIWPFIQ